MNINQIEPGVMVDLNVYIEDRMLDFHTEVVDISNEFSGEISAIAVKTIFADGKTVKFSDEFRYELFANIDEKPYLWTDLSIKFVRLKKSKECVHFIISDQIGQQYNRRESYRLWVGESAVAMVGYKHKLVETTIKDISATGISILVNRDVTLSEKIDVGSPVKVEFEDKDTKSRFNISALVARIEESDVTRDVYGCKMRARSSAVERYVMQKQRDRLKTGQAPNNE